MGERLEPSSEFRDAAYDLEEFNLLSEREKEILDNEIKTAYGVVIDEAFEPGVRRVLIDANGIIVKKSKSMFSDWHKDSVMKEQGYPLFHFVQGMEDGV